MEATLYDDNSQTEVNRKRKMNMTLDFQQSVKSKQEKLLSAGLSGSDMLNTPDFGMFMLASPDLERFIVQPNGLVLTTPTPTSTILFPKSVTEEQEAYARGFIDALAELHKNSGASTTATAAASVTTNAMSNAAVSLTSKPVLPTSTFQLIGTQPTRLGTVQPQLPMMVAVANSAPAVKIEAAQTVPAFTTTTTTCLPPPPGAPEQSFDIKPIDMDEQEIVKLERKRARNRLAATRCRNRKLERISRLEERVAELKSQNSHLAQSAAALRDEVSQLKRGIVEHTRRGCQVMLTHNLM